MGKGQSRGAQGSRVSGAQLLKATPLPQATGGGGTGGVGSSRAPQDSAFSGAKPLEGALCLQPPPPPPGVAAARFPLGWGLAQTEQQCAAGVGPRKDWTAWAGRG